MAKKTKKPSETPPWEKTATRGVDPEITPPPVRQKADFSEAEDTVLTGRVEKVDARVFGGGDSLFGDGAPKFSHGAVIRAWLMGAGWRKLAAIGGAIFLVLLFSWLILRGGSGVDEKPAVEETAAPQAPPPSALATVRLYTTPDSARIFLNGKLMGNSPVEINALRPGDEYLIEMQQPGYETGRTKLKLQSGETRELRLALVASGVALKVRSEPTGAEVFIDGKTRGVTPLEIRLAAATQIVKVELRKPGFVPFAQFVPVGKQPIELNPRLETRAVAPPPAKVGYLSLDAEPMAIVYINDRRLDRITPIKDMALPAGTYNVRFENPANKKKRVQKVELKPQQHLRLKVSLK